MVQCLKGSPVIQEPDEMKCEVTTADEGQEISNSWTDSISPRGLFAGTGVGLRALGALCFLIQRRRAGLLPPPTRNGQRFLRNCWALQMPPHPLWLCKALAFLFHFPSLFLSLPSLHIYCLPPIYQQYVFVKIQIRERSRNCIHILTT